jgi:hypothetical protein
LNAKKVISVLETMSTTAVAPITEVDRPIFGLAQLEI